MKVYIVTWERGYEDKEIVAVFLDEQTANEFADQKDREIHGPSWSAGSHHVYDEEVIV